MTGPTPAWVPLLDAALVRGPEVTSPTGHHTSTWYTQVPGSRDRLVEGMAGLLMYLYGPTAAAAENPSWRSGGAVGRKTWEKLLHRDDSGDFPELKSAVGEAFAWWHERLTPTVAYAQRPFFGTSMPVVDSLSLVECGAEHGVRGVQAKVTAGRPRPRVSEALDKFERLQGGEFDKFWGEAVYRFEMEVRASGGPAFDPSAVASGDQLLHFSIVVCHEVAAETDPAWDYHPRVAADPPHGRSAAYLLHAPLDDLVADVAAVIRATVL